MKNDSILIHDVPHQSLAFHPIRSDSIWSEPIPSHSVLTSYFPVFVVKGEGGTRLRKYYYFRKPTLTRIWLIRFCFSFLFLIYLCISFSFSFLFCIFYCIYDACGYQVAWIHIDRQMILTIHRHVISKIPRYSITYDNANTWQLHVNQAQQEDRG